MLEGTGEATNGGQVLIFDEWSASGVDVTMCFSATSNRQVVS